MKLGLQIPSFSWPGGAGRDRADPRPGSRRQADDIGFDSIWVMDHFFQIRGVGPAEEPMLEGWTTLGFLAANTKRARLGLMVGGVHYRLPGLWVKAATTLDVLSGGRAWLGIGAAWNEDESRSLGFPFPPLGERFEMLEETLRIAHEMWQGERGSEAAFDGRQFHATRLMNSPQSISRPRVPIMIGGGGEKKTLRLVAQYADATNVFGGPEAIAHKYEVLREHCAAVGRELRRDRALEPPDDQPRARDAEPGRRPVRRAVRRRRPARDLQRGRRPRPEAPRDDRPRDPAPAPRAVALRPRAPRPRRPAPEHRRLCSGERRLQGRGRVNEIGCPRAQDGAVDLSLRREPPTRNSSAPVSADCRREPPTRKRSTPDGRITGDSRLRAGDAPTRAERLGHGTLPGHEICRRTGQDDRRIAVVRSTQDDRRDPFPGRPRRPGQWRSGGWRTSRVRNKAPRVPWR